MKTKIYRLGKNALAIWGGISLIGIIIILYYIANTPELRNKTVENKATTSDVRFVLNNCGLGDQQIEKVLNSYQSRRSFTGDYLDAYAIEVTNVTERELQNNNGWYRLDSLPIILKDAIELANGWQHEIPWFPKLNEINPEYVFVYPCSIERKGEYTTSTELVFILPNDKMVYYLGTKM